MLEPPGPLPRVLATVRADAHHYTPGRGGYAIEYLVLHATETNRPGNAPSLGWLTTDSPPPAANVSAHHLYGRDGTRYDLVYRTDTAYHAGKCRVEAMNARSLGHEIENSNGPGHVREAYSDAQLNAVAYTVACEMISYGLPWARVVCHRDVAIPAGRKADPVGLDLGDLARRVQAWEAFLRSVPADQTNQWFI